MQPCEAPLSRHDASSELCVRRTRRTMARRGRGSEPRAKFGVARRSPLQPPRKGRVPQLHDRLDAIKNDGPQSALHSPESTIKKPTEARRLRSPRSSPVRSQTYNAGTPPPLPHLLRRLLLLRRSHRRRRSSARRRRLRVGCRGNLGRLWVPRRRCSFEEGRKVRLREDAVSAKRIEDRGAKGDSR